MVSLMDHKLQTDEKPGTATPLRPYHRQLPGQECMLAYVIHSGISAMTLSKARLPNPAASVAEDS